MAVIKSQDAQKVYDEDADFNDIGEQIKAYAKRCNNIELKNELYGIATKLFEINFAIQRLYWTLGKEE